tara:strand:+ start:211 stop:348 length:138 start_codon:yes stop_codon:yes gene_type:complete
MAKAQVNTYSTKAKTKRKGIHAKSKTSLVKGSKNYKKLYKGQGKT